MRKQLVGKHPTISSNNHHLMECAADILEDVSPYFNALRSHYDVTCGLQENVMYTYPTVDLRIKIIGEIDITGVNVHDTMFYEHSRMDSHVSDRYSEPAIKINVNGYFAGWYLPRINVICAADWTHGSGTVSTFRQVWPKLITLLDLKILPEEKRIKEEKIKIDKITMGCDPEFELVNGQGDVIYAGMHIVSDEDGNGNNLGVDGADDQVELRPRAGDPRQVVSNIKKLFKMFSEQYGEYKLSDEGDEYPLGGHIHVGIGRRWRPDSGLAHLLDDFVGRAVINLSGEARDDYKRLASQSLDAIRIQPHGFEYRSPPSAVFQNPAITYITLTLVKNLCEKYFQEVPLEYDSRPTLEDYMNVGGLTKQQAKYFMKFIEEYEPTKNITANWHITPSKSFEPATITVIFSDKWHPLVKEWINRFIKEKVKVSLPIIIKLHGLGERRGRNLCTIPTGRTALVEDIPHKVWNASTRTLQIGLSYNRRTMDGYNNLFGIAFVNAISKYIKENCR